MKNLSDLTRPIPAMLAAFGIVLVLCTPVIADPIDYATCVAKNKKFPGAIGVCASSICNWEVCKDSIIYSTGSTGRIAGASVSYREDKGAEGSALATCMPYETIMNRCMQANVQAAASAPWCKTGSDSDIPDIKSKLNAIATGYNEGYKQLKVQEFQLEILGSEIDELLVVVKRMGESFLSDKAAAGGSEEAHKAFLAEWDTGGRLALAQSRQRKHTAKVTQFNNTMDQIKADKAAFEESKDKADYVTATLMNGNRDCAGALAYLQ